MFQLPVMDGLTWTFVFCKQTKTVVESEQTLSVNLHDLT